jgi:predicted RNase H-related nuclease YkuK (DUF458 family)
MFYNSPTYGRISLEQLKKIISRFMSSDEKAKYEIVVGTDSQKLKKDTHDFVSALIIHRVGWGGIYFWKRQILERKISLKERIYQEATMSLETSENFVNFFKTNGISKYNIQIHVDIGHNGETRDLITEVVGMVRGSGYDVKIKPDSYGASKVADKYT